MTDAAIGTARIDVTVDTSQFDSAVSAAKRAVSDMSTSAQQQYQQLAGAEKRLDVHAVVDWSFGGRHVVPLPVFDFPGCGGYAPSAKPSVYSDPTGVCESVNQRSPRSIRSNASRFPMASFTG